MTSLLIIIAIIAFGLYRGQSDDPLKIWEWLIIAFVTLMVGWDLWQNPPNHHGLRNLLK